MNKFLLAAAIVLIAGTTASAPAQSPEAAASTVRDGSHDFDFSLGSWRTDVTIIKDPFNNPNKVACT
jgi:hypothetical protein